MVLRCTKRFHDLLGSRGPLTELSPGPDDWYANVYIVERRVCLLLIHAETLFSVLDTDVRVAYFDDIGLYLATQITDALASEGLRGTTLGPTDPSDITIAKTARRSVLGHMNEMIFEAELLIQEPGGLERADIDALDRRLRRDLRGRGDDYVVPLELAAARSA
jgi:hypothetical protein